MEWIVKNLGDASLVALALVNVGIVVGGHRRMRISLDRLWDRVSGKDGMADRLAALEATVRTCRTCQGERQ